MACPVPGLVVHVARLLHVLVHDDSLNMRMLLKRAKQNVTQASQEIPHPTTGWAHLGFIAEIGRDRMRMPEL